MALWTRLLRRVRYRPPLPEMLALLDADSSVHTIYVYTEVSAWIMGVVPQWWVVERVDGTGEAWRFDLSRLAGRASGNPRQKAAIPAAAIGRLSLALRQCDFWRLPSRLPMTCWTDGEYCVIACADRRHRRVVHGNAPGEESEESPAWAFIQIVKAELDRLVLESTT